MVVGGLGQHGDGVAGSLYLLSPIKLFLESLVMQCYGTLQSYCARMRMAIVPRLNYRLLPI